MPQKSYTPSLHHCPYIDEGYSACSSKFTIGQLDQACSVCFGSYQSCSVYRHVAGISGTTIPDMTINGHAIELRPTGS